MMSVTVKHCGSIAGLLCMPEYAKGERVTQNNEVPDNSEQQRLKVNSSNITVFSEYGESE